MANHLKLQYHNEANRPAEPAVQTVPPPTPVARSPRVEEIDIEAPHEPVANHEPQILADETPPPMIAVAETRKYKNLFVKIGIVALAVVSACGFGVSFSSITGEECGSSREALRIAGGMLATFLGGIAVPSPWFMNTAKDDQNRMLEINYKNMENLLAHDRNVRLMEKQRRREARRP